MIGGMAKLAGAAWNLAGRALSGFADWLRRPRDWWRFAVVVLGVVCIGFAFAAKNARQEVLVVTERCNSRVLTIETEAKEATRLATETADANRRALQVCQAQLAEEVGKRQEIDQLGQEAVAAAREDAAQARNALERWRARYNRRPATCSAALEAMEAACADTITDY